MADYDEQGEQQKELDDLSGSEAFAALDALENEAAQFDGDEPTEGETPEQSIPTEALLMGAFSPLFDIFAPNWNVTKEEKTALCESYAGVIDKYYPDGVGGRFAAELTALTVTGMIVAPRIGKDRHLADELPEPRKPTPNSSEFADSAAPESGAELGVVNGR
jgi:hypothetical protein